MTTEIDTSDPREAKLPAWARKLLAAERSRAATAEKKLTEHLETVVESRIWYGAYDNPIYVPMPFSHQTVHFDLGSAAHHYQDVQVQLGPDGLTIMGGAALSIDPQVSNVIKVRFRDA